ncbi:hypothetical protein DSL64_09630 [Dyadobacter luteus]|uniref:Glycosyltransferase n=1 Tax=Dyadobacter luteus TaxID=2259619 RepID=A0A3D8YGQ1_9BACT|nr:glycosyltransferase [Dyadobacter luteus]REA62499.1 hypothetical protein DSL64_09630 [Dyadobacter luteus]
MKKVLYIVSTLQRTGPTNVLYNLISHLDRSIYHPIILTLSPENPQHHSLKQQFIDLGIPIHTLGLSRIDGFLKGTKKIMEFVKEKSIDVIHINGFRGDWMLRSVSSSDLKVITTINSNIFDDYTMLYGKLKGYIMAILHIRSIKNKIGIACSNAVADQLNKKYNSNLKVINNGIPKEIYFTADDSVKVSIRNELKLPTNKKVFIFVGYLIYRKDPITTVKAFINSNVCEDSALIMIGDGPLMNECKEISKEYKNIYFLGNTSETLKYLQASDYYIASSLSEGLPTSVMEAMGCGLPVLLSEIAPHHELVSKMGNWKYTFPTGAIDTLSFKIDELSADNYQVLSRRNRNVIDHVINANTMAASYQYEYQ